MPTLPINDTEIFYRKEGRGDETIVFSHGLLLDHSQYDRQVDALRDDYRCIAYDHRGQGRSAVPDRPLVDMETLYFDAVELIERFDAAPCHFVGLSMGGFVGLRVAARRPDLVRSLTLIDTRAGAEPKKNIPKYQRLNFVARWFGIGLVSARVLPILFGDTFLDGSEFERARAKWRERLEGNSKEIYKAVNGVLHRPSVESEVEGIDVPTQVIHGEEDEAIPLSTGRALADAIDGAGFVPIPEAGHTPTVENPTAVNDALRSFLSDL